MSWGRAFLVWLVLTLLFELALGRLVLSLSWDRIASDYDLSRGGLLAIGLVFLVLSPLIATRFRAKRSQSSKRRDAA
jgi:hypothetical protein